MLLIRLLVLMLLSGTLTAQIPVRVLGIHQETDDVAHVSFYHDAHRWFAAMATRHGFQYDSTSVWDSLRPATLARYQVLIFLNARPEGVAQRKAFQEYMTGGGAWMGFHFAGFALTPSAFPQNWDWYHEEFLGAGQYVSNTWRPTSATLRVEQGKHPLASALPAQILSAPNEWYRWQHDLRKNTNINILLSIDPVSFPLGTGPKPHEIWHSGYYPVAWSNKNYRMIYFNMGHDDMDYTPQPDVPLSHTFGVAGQDVLILKSLLWLMRR